MILAAYCWEDLMNHLRQRLDVLFRDFHLCEDISVDGHGRLEHLPNKFLLVLKPLLGRLRQALRRNPHRRDPPLVARVVVLTAVGVLRHVPEFLGLVETVKVFLLHAQRISVAS